MSGNAGAFCAVAVERCAQSGACPVQSRARSGDRYPENNSSVARRQVLPASQFDDFSLEVTQPQHRSLQIQTDYYHPIVGGLDRQRNTFAEFVQQAQMATGPSALVRQHATRHTEQPQPLLATGWDLIQATPRNEHRFGNDVTGLIRLGDTT